jgi:ATP-dependent Clp protease ATP-binding subunit ClpC
MDEAASKVRIALYVSPPDLKDLEDKRETIRKEKEEAITHQNFEKAANLRDEEKKLADEIEKTKSIWEKERQSKEGIVTEEEIAQVVASWTSIPVSKLTEDEAATARPLEGHWRQCTKCWDAWEQAPEDMLARCPSCQTLTLLRESGPAAG